MRKVKHIKLVFENCETATLDPSMFRGLSVAHITKSYAINCAQYKDGEGWDSLACDAFRITITAKGLEKAELTPEFQRSTLRERLAHKDITHIELMYEDFGESDYIAVPWSDSTSEFTNDLQVHRWSDESEDCWVGASALHIDIVEPSRKE